ncbi:uncharacterized protein TNCV_221031 [Trichonephila clavipes]|nr:uncharacterized protein TNCV_221031 [Trichonephila clavipes]
MGIRTSSSDSNSSNYKSNTFEGMRPRSNESHYSRKNVLGEKRELEEKCTGLKKDQVERQTSIASYRRPLSGSGGPERKCRKDTGHKVDERTLTVTNSNDLPHFRKRLQTEETMILSTSGYNLRPRGDAKVEFRPANEKRTQQRGPVRSRRSREKLQDGHYAGNQRRSSSRNTRSRRGQQQQCQERTLGANSQKTPVP